MSATHPGTTGRRSASTTTATNVEPLLVKPRQAWQMLGCGNSYGYQLLASGELESFLDGKARKITVASIREYINRKLAGSAKGKTPGPSRRRRSHSSDTDQGRVAA